MPLQTVGDNEIEGASVDTVTNFDFTLPAGTYFIDCIGLLGLGGGSNPTGGQLRLYNTTDASQTLLGIAAQINSADNGGEPLHLRGWFTIADAKTFEIQAAAESTSYALEIGDAVTNLTE